MAEKNTFFGKVWQAWDNLCRWLFINPDEPVPEAVKDKSSLTIAWAQSRAKIKDLERRQRIVRRLQAKAMDKRRQEAKDRLWQACQQPHDIARKQMRLILKDYHKRSRERG